MYPTSPRARTMCVSPSATYSIRLRVRLSRGVCFVSGEPPAFLVLHEFQSRLLEFVSSRALPLSRDSVSSSGAVCRAVSLLRARDFGAFVALWGRRALTRAFRRPTDQFDPWVPQFATTTSPSSHSAIDEPASPAACAQAPDCFIPSQSVISACFSARPRASLRTPATFSRSTVRSC